MLEAGAYGVSQSRKRAFIWAAAPGEVLPEWPEPMHVFGTPELKIKLSKRSHYAAVRSTQYGAPFRSITVKDTINDLPPIENGESETNREVCMIDITHHEKNIFMIHISNHFFFVSCSMELIQSLGSKRR